MADALLVVVSTESDREFNRTLDERESGQIGAQVNAQDSKQPLPQRFKHSWFARNNGATGQPVSFAGVRGFGLGYRVSSGRTLSIGASRYFFGFASIPGKPFGWRLRNKLAGGADRRFGLAAGVVETLHF